VKATIWDPSKLVIDMEFFADDDALQSYLSSLPLVNKALRPAFITETVPVGTSTHRIIRFPGALVSPDPANPPTDPPSSATNGFSVVVYKVSGTSTPTEIQVLAETRVDPADQNCGTFSVIPPMLTAGECGASFDPNQNRGIVSVTVNYPFQSAALTGFKSAGFDANGAPNPNISNRIDSPDDPATTPAGTYTGSFGLGNQAAFGGMNGNKYVRPYRTLLLGQAIFRRDVIQ
jgi:hypothetical protein